MIMAGWAWILLAAGWWRPGMVIFFLDELVVEGWPYRLLWADSRVTVVM